MNHEATLGQPNFVALEKGEKFVLNERKAREIKEHLHSQMPLPNNVELQNVEAIKCQCGWNGQEAAMVCLSFEEMTDANLYRLNAAFVILASIFCATDSEMPLTLGYQKPMLVINAYLSQMSHTFSRK